jgi:hypothetical protein
MLYGVIRESELEGLDMVRRLNTIDDLKTVNGANSVNINDEVKRRIPRQPSAASLLILRELTIWSEVIVEKIGSVAHGTVEVERVIQLDAMCPCALAPRWRIVMNSPWKHRSEICWL